MSESRGKMKFFPAFYKKNGRKRGALSVEVAVLYFLVFLAGACVFSFINVVIYRVPRRQSFVTGRSVCPSCGHTLGPADLVPIASWLLLRGKCRYCGAAIGVRDTLVELLGGAAAVVCLHHFGVYPAAAVVFLFYSVLTAAAFLDLDTMEIPDGCPAAIAALALAACAVMPQIGWMQRLIGMVCVSIPMLLLALAIPGAFGGGDIKLIAAGGLFLGWKLNVVAAALAILGGGLYGVFLLVSGRKKGRDRFAFGPFLCLGMAAAALWGERIADWYLSFLLI